MPASSSPWPPASASARSPPGWSVIGPPSGASAGATSRVGWRSSCWTTPAWGGRRRFPPLQRAQIVELACLEPVAKGLHITHWSSSDLARQAVADGIVGRISPRTVRTILSAVDLQPHRTRYWKTARLDARFKERGMSSGNAWGWSRCPRLRAGSQPRLYSEGVYLRAFFRLGSSWFVTTAQLRRILCRWLAGPRLLLFFGQVPG